jgi:hypothetical protein
MTNRQRLQQRRSLETVAIEVQGQRFKVGLGRAVNVDARGRAIAPAGPIVEVWLNAQKVNSLADVMASDAAILISLLMQYGHPASEIVASLKRTPDGSPASPIGVAALLACEAQQEITNNTEQGE